MNEKKGLVPRLRFPEFREAGEWVKSYLGNKEIASFVRDRTPLEKLTLESYVSTENLLTDYAGVTFSAKLPSAGSFTGFKKSDILISNIRPYLKKVWFATKDGGASNDIIVVRAKSEIGAAFLAYLLKNDYFINYIMKGAKGVKMPRGDISLIREYPVAVPESAKEQQKITDCLSSLDALITAQADKLDALKTHKKGLMQQLFPREGETVPRLRFPEFREAGEWVRIQLWQLGELVSGLTYSPDDVRDEGLLVLRSSNIQNGVISLQDNVYVRPDIKGANLSKPDDILICVRNGSKPLIGKNALIPPGLPRSTHGAFMSAFRARHPKFVYQLFQTDAYERQVAADLGATINSINGNTLRKYEFDIPESKEEQHKIADCLASLDTLIAAEAEKLVALKTHKKGLMQQLFPNPEAVAA